jgi:hypothetical protein
MNLEKALPIIILTIIVVIAVAGLTVRKETTGKAVSSAWNEKYEAKELLDFAVGTRGRRFREDAANSPADYSSVKRSKKAFRGDAG